MKRLLRLLALVLLATALITPVLVSAQLEPTTIIDAVLQDLTTKLGKPVTRVNSNWTWEQQNFPDTSYGCPQPGAAYTQVATKGYIIKIELRESFGNYDYRTSLDGSVLILCSAVPPLDSKGTVAPNVPPTSVPPANLPAAPVTLSSPVLAYLGPDGNVTVTSLNGSGSPVALTGDANRRYESGSLYPQEDHSYSNLQWSPDGTRLAFTDIRTGTVFVVNAGQAAQVVANAQAAFFPAAFSPDSKEIAYLVPANSQTLQLQAVTGAGAAPRVVGTIQFGSGCGGGGFPPSMVQYYMDAGYSGNPITLRWLPRGFLHTLNCTGVGLRMVDFNGNTLWEQPSLKRAAVSPDGTRIVAISQAATNNDPNLAGDSVVMVDLTTGATTTLFTGTPQSIERVGWSPDGSQVLFNTKRVARSVQGSASSQIGSGVFIDWPATIAYTYTLELSTIAPVAGSAPRLLTSFEGYGIGNIVASANSLFSAVTVISSDVPAVEKLNAGGTPNDLVPLRSKVSVYTIAAGGNAQLSIPEGASPVYSTALQFVAVPAAQTSAALNPPTLVVGGQAVVNVKDGDAINIRQTASRSAPVIKTLPRGAIVTILGSYQEVEGLRWWPVRVEPTGETGWAVDQVTENGVTEFTLIPK